MNKTRVMTICVISVICLYLTRPQVFTSLIADKEASYNESYSEQSLFSKKEQMYQYLSENLEPYFDE